VVTMPKSCATASFASDYHAATQWYALQVHPPHTTEITGILKRKGYDAFTPWYRVTRRWCDRTCLSEVPLFPGYVFVKMDIRYRMPVLTTSGVRAVVGIGKQPAPIPEDEIVSLQGVVHSGLQIQPWPFLGRRGDRVQIEDGPLAGIAGTLVDVKKTCRVVISVELIERAVAVEIDLDSVRVTRRA